MTQMDEPRTQSARTPRLTELDLAVLQVQAVERFTEHLRETQAAADAPTSREARMDAARLRDVLRRQHDALVGHCDRQLAATPRPALSLADRRVVIAHRNAWFIGKLAQALEARRVHVVAALQNGADAVGVAVAEQPDLILVEDALPMTTGVEVVRQVGRFSPGTAVAAQVAYADGMAALLDAGAAAVFVRSVPPLEVADGLLEMLDQPSER
jgi:CheY-like chemotaxis protein